MLNIHGMACCHIYVRHEPLQISKHFFASIQVKFSGSLSASNHCPWQTAYGKWT